MSRSVFPHLKSVFVPRKYSMLTIVVTDAGMKFITGGINIKYLILRLLFREKLRHGLRNKSTMCRQAVFTLQIIVLDDTLEVPTTR